MIQNNINVIINGANGKMGKTAVSAIAHEDALTLVACGYRNDDLATLIQQHHADVVIDLTSPDAVFNNTKTIIDAGARPVIGTTGLTTEQIHTLTDYCADKKRGCIIAPNFSIGAVLMMRYAKDAAKYFSDVEIIEYHNPHKKDSPSGTAKKTAELIQKPTLSDGAKNGQGHIYQNIPIHSVRVPGVFANQQVIFGGHGETFMLQHAAIDRGAMMPGLFLCCQKVMTLDHLVYGMESIIV